MTTGSIEPKTPKRYGCEPKIKDEQLGELRVVVAEKNDRTLQQLCDLWDERKHVLVDDATMYRALKRAGLSLKKKAARRASAKGPTSSRNATRSAQP